MTQQSTALSSRQSDHARLTSLTSKSIDPSPIFTYLSRYPKVAGYTHQFVDWDTSLCIHINGYARHQGIALFFKVISRLGDGWFWYAMLISSLLYGGWSAVPVILAIIATSLIGVALYKILKVKTVRPRPYQVHQVIVLKERPLDKFSFPSGHTLQAVLFTCTLGLYFPVLLWLMLPFTLLVALSRMVLGLHYPTDVLIGALLGYGLAGLTPMLVGVFGG